MTTDGSSTLPPAINELEELRRDNQLLRAQRDQLLESQQYSARTIESLQHQLQQLLRRMYGRSAEKINPQQMALFEKLLEQLAPRVPETIVAEPVPAEAASTAPGHGRRRLPADLPRERVIHDLPEEEKPCPCCGKLRHVMGQEISEQLDYEPAKLKVIEHVRLKYVCHSCEQSAVEGGPQIVLAEKPLMPVEKGLAAPGLLAHVIVSHQFHEMSLAGRVRISKVSVAIATLIL
ncbi:MAG TPA: IS66 family transposase zinc-finger binding domain-containing protein [Phycisphaerae bacterium]|nr:IS66 family transposase zinc-finger binding domain-containing protein [Phycisphaerae bacterium]